MTYPEYIEQERSKADQALTSIPKGEDLKLRAAFARLKEWSIAKDKYQEWVKKFGP